jgi:hypothetical protein
MERIHVITTINQTAQLPAALEWSPVYDDSFAL